MPDSRRRYDWGTVALDIVLAGGALVALVVSVVFSPEGLPALSVCPFRRWTGLPCAGCGITRAFCAIGHGEFGSAWDYNPFGFLFYAATVALLFWPLIRRMWPDVEKRLILSSWLGRAAILMIAVVWVFGVARILGALCAR